MSTVKLGLLLNFTPLRHYYLRNFEGGGGEEKGGTGGKCSPSLRPWTKVIVRVRAPLMLCKWGTNSSTPATVVCNPHETCAHIAIYPVHSIKIGCYANSLFYIKCHNHNLVLGS